MKPASLLLCFSPLLAQVQFHHLTLNTTNPAAAIDFYSTHFDCQKAQKNGQAAIRAGNSWLLFNKVKQPPPSAIDSAIWHFGWGAEDMPKAYADQLAKGATFDTPLTDISDLARSPNFYYAYVKGPDGALIELNTAAHHRFGHLHLFSADPIAAGQWWAKHFGVKWPPNGRLPSPEPRLYRGAQVGPSANFMLGDVNVIIFPIGYLPDKTKLVTTKGRVVDHIGLAVPDLAAARQRLKSEGIKMKGNFLVGPDNLLIQLVKQ